MAQPVLFWGLRVGDTVTGDHWQVFSLKGCSLGSKTETQSTSRSRGFTDGINMDVSWNLKARSKTALGTGYPLILLPHHFGFHLTHHGSPEPSFHHHILSTSAHIGARFPLCLPNQILKDQPNLIGPIQYFAPSLGTGLLDQLGRGRQVVCIKAAP